MPGRHLTSSNGWRHCLLLRALLCGWNDHHPGGLTHRQTALWQPCLKFRSSQRRICSCLLERGCVDFGTVDMSCSWLVLHSQQSQSVSSSSPSQRPWGGIDVPLKRLWREATVSMTASRFLAVQEWKYRCGCNEDRVNSFWKYISMCRALQRSGDIGRVCS